MLTSNGSRSANLSTLDGQPDAKARAALAFLLHVQQDLGRKSIGPLIRSLKNHFLDKVEQENHDVFEHPSVKTVSKVSKLQTFTARERSAKVQAHIKQGLPHEALCADLDLLHTFVTNGTACLVDGDVWSVVVALATLYSYVFACRVSEVGSSGSGEQKHKHTLRCNEVHFLLQDGRLVEAGKLLLTDTDVTRVTFLRRTAKMRAETIISSVNRQAEAEGARNKYTQRDVITGKRICAPFDHIDSNLFLDALVLFSRHSGVQEKCYFFSRAVDGSIRAVNAKHLNTHVKEAAQRLGLSSFRFSTASLKKGHVQTLQASKWTEQQQQASAAHRVPASTQHYRTKLAEGAESTIFAAGGTHTAAFCLDEARLLDAGTKHRQTAAASNKKRSREEEQ